MATAAAAMGFPFTVAQWKELERQAMIYKYMMASLPVPLDLLYNTFPTHLPTTFTPAASYLVGRYGGNGLNLNSKLDAEVGRCRRTDGKKWRCSRDVAPNHKYCERHLQRGRPRSRKPVELLPNSNSPMVNNNKNSNKKTRLDGPNTNPKPVGSSLPLIPHSKVSTFDHPVGSSANPFEDSRSMGWNEEQQWQQLVQANMNSLGGIHHQFEGLNSQSDFSSKSEMGLFERPLIDAWSMGLGLARSKEDSGNNKSSLVVPSRGIHGNVLDEDMCQIHMGLGVIDSWVASDSSLGGPLAEVLRPGPLTVGSKQSSNRTASESHDLVSPPATGVSSPSGVLLRTFASRSDGSGNNSPTCHNSKANSDMPFHWLN